MKNYAYKLIIYNTTNRKLSIKNGILDTVILYSNQYIHFNKVSGIIKVNNMIRITIFETDFTEHGFTVRLSTSHKIRYKFKTEIITDQKNIEELLEEYIPEDIHADDVYSAIIISNQ